MIHNKFKNLIDDLQSVHLTKDEKSQLKDRVFRCIEKTEAIFEVDSLSQSFTESIAQTSTIGAGAGRVGRSVASSWYSYFAEKKFIPAFAVLLILVSTGGISMAAEKALPGDFLYSLKVNINEEVKGLAAITPEAKAKLALEVTDRRLKEAALLSSQGRLDENASGIIQEQLLKQAGQVKNQVASLVATNQLQAAQLVALNFESALRTHEFILQKLSDNKGTSTESTSDHISSIIAAVRTELATTTLSRADLQSKERELVANQTREEVTNRLGQLRANILDLINISHTAVLTDAASSTVGLYLTQAKDLSVVAGVKISIAQYSSALTDIQKASQYISDAEAIISANAIDLNADKNTQAVIQAALTSSTTLPISTIDQSVHETASASTTASTTESVAGTDTATSTESTATSTPSN